MDRKNKHKNIKSCLFCKKKYETAGDLSQAIDYRTDISLQGVESFLAETKAQTIQEGGSQLRSRD